MTDKPQCDRHAALRVSSPACARCELAEARAELAAASERIAALEAERDEARVLLVREGQKLAEAECTLLAVCRVVQLSPEAARHLARHPPMLTPEEMAWAHSPTQRKWTGRELLDDAKMNADLFTRGDMDRLLSEAEGLLRESAAERIAALEAAMEKVADRVVWVRASMSGGDICAEMDSLEEAASEARVLLIREGKT